jgi:hypothetical protein
MNGGRVQAHVAQGLYLVRVDSTAPHNRYVIAGHGQLSERDLADVERALDGAPRGALVVVLLHHHPLPLPEEEPLERLSAFFGWPFTAELHTGRTLLERLRGRCDLVLHGHRHVASAHHLYVGDPRPLLVFNAGSSTKSGRARLFCHDQGRLLGWPTWLHLGVAARQAA